MAQEFVGWEVELANNKIIREGQLEWTKVPYYEGCNKICYHVEEFTGKFNLEVINTNER
jgi:hypothetical protein